MTVMTSEEFRREAARVQARKLRFKKPLVRELNLEEMRENLAEMDEACANVRWFVGANNDELEEILGEDDAYEFRMSFTALGTDIERIQEEMDDIWVPDYFDDFMAAVNPEGSVMMGYDSYEEDFFRLDSYESEAACREAKERIQRKTKSEIIDCCHTVIGILMQYMAVKYRFDSLGAAFDVLMDRTEKQLRAVKEIEEAYTAADTAKFYDWNEATRKLDRLLRELPDQYWIE